jgi:hypothetical protein
MPLADAIAIVLGCGSALAIYHFIDARRRRSDRSDRSPED